MDFIKKFLTEKVFKEDKAVSEQDNFVKKTNIEKIEISSLNNNMNQNLVNDDIVKQLAWYLWNDTNLDRSLLNMNKTKTNQNLKWTIKIEKESVFSWWKWVLAQFIIWIILIFVTFSYVKTQPAEQKFLQSSVELWSNTFQNLLSHLWWVFTKSVDQTYIEKRQKLIDTLIWYKKDLEICLDNTKDEEKRKNISKLLQQVITFKNELSNTQLISLDNFIQKYDQYNLYVYSLSSAVKKECSK